MIDVRSLSPEWLAEKRRQYKKDPGIMESMIHALYLLDQLKLTGLDFIFKGGTSLILLMGHSGRLELFNEKIEIKVYMVTHPDYNYLNKRLKFIARGEALFYWHRTLKLLYPERA